MQHHNKPATGLMIYGSDPNLICELENSYVITDFPDLLDHFDGCALLADRLLTLSLPMTKMVANYSNHEVIIITES